MKHSTLFSILVGANVMAWALNPVSGTRLLLFIDDVTVDRRISLLRFSQML